MSNQFVLTAAYPKHSVTHHELKTHIAIKCWPQLFSANQRRTIVL